MNKWHVLALSVSLATSSAAVASSASLTQFTPRVMPVLVQVSAQGKVTGISPSQDLTPALARLLRSNVQELISGPALVRGKPMPSQLVLNMALQATPTERGKYSAQFTYVSSSPVPSGSWYWVHIDGHRLALAEQGSRRTFERLPDQRVHHAQPMRNAAPAIIAQPTMQSPNTPAPAVLPVHAR